MISLATARGEVSEYSYGMSPIATSVLYRDKVGFVQVVVQNAVIMTLGNPSV